MLIYNTLTKEKEEFKPQEEGIVRLYACGPTVYDHFTIGNARPFILFDALRRYLKYKGYRVIYVLNITDIDDKIINRAAAEGITPKEVAEKYTKSFFEDLKLLGVEKADYHPKATEKIPEMISFIQELIERGYAYQANGDVYFRVRRFRGYGKLSGRSLDELSIGARMEDVHKNKEDPLDFALWKGSKEGEPSWESPWGQGRPGWHIECSVMASSILGDHIDIHAGGEDLIFPHHENEIAQTEAKTGKPFAKYWMHNGLVMYEGEKMSKSLGNFEYARDVVRKYGREAVRLFYLSKHYRKPINFTHEGMEDAKRAVERVYNLLEEIDFELKKAPEKKTENIEFKNYLDKVKEGFIEEMDDDFNTAGAVGVIFELVRETNTFKQEYKDPHLLEQAADLIRELGEILGLFQGQEGIKGIGIERELIELLIEVRGDLRAKKEWELADKIRSRLKEFGIALKDKEENTIWSFKKS
jgi:cysteinyl-tRNA synthetase